MKDFFFSKIWKILEHFHVIFSICFNESIAGLGISPGEGSKNVNCRSGAWANLFWKFSTKIAHFWTKLKENIEEKWCSSHVGVRVWDIVIKKTIETSFLYLQLGTIITWKRPWMSLTRCKIFIPDSYSFSHSHSSIPSVFIRCTYICWNSRVHRDVKFSEIYLRKLPKKLQKFRKFWGIYKFL